MWVVKLGGSLSRDPIFPEWLQLLAHLGAGRVVVVCGGGTFADEVRSAQQYWGFDDLPAHNMAVLAMAQTTYMAHGLQPALHLTESIAGVYQALRDGKAALWLPYCFMRDRPGRDAHWDTTSDSIALDLAHHLNAERLIVVKSCAIDPDASLEQLGELGVIDGRFASLAQGAPFAIDLIQRGELARMRSALGDVRLER